MKRYKVVQDGRGHWGIWDMESPRSSEEFASWGDSSDHGAWLWSEIVTYARGLNSLTERRDDFAWEFYRPRAEA